MAICSINSTNPNFSYIIRKNPNSGMLIRSQRRGMLFGFYSKDIQNYCLYFKDADTKISYKEHFDEDFEYLNTSRYSDPLAIQNSIKELLHYNLKTCDELDVPMYKHTVEIGLVYVKNERFLAQYTGYYNEFEISYIREAGKNYKIIITTTTSLHKLLNFVNLLMIFLTIVNNRSYLIEELAVQSYIEALNTIDSPYFIRYLFKRHLVKKQSLFNTNKELLEKSDRYKITMLHGDNLLHRKIWTESIIKGDFPLVDIGSGEGNFLYLKKKVNKYFAIDIDEKKRELLAKKIVKRQLADVTILENFEDFIELTDSKDKLDILLTEVIEHLSLQEAKVFYQKILKLDINKLLITTPNKNFNKYYMIKDDGARHEDHKFEFVPGEFEEFIKQGLPRSYTYKIYSIGDCVDNEYPTFGAVIWKEDSNG